MKRVWRAIGYYFKTTDTLLLGLWLLASGLSVVFLAGIYHSGLIDYRSTLITHVVAITMGLTAAVIISCMDYHMILRFWKLYVPVCFVLILLTLLVGNVRGDNQAWLLIPIGGGRSVSVQPSEFAKIAFITTFAMHLNKVKAQMNKPVQLALLLAHGGAYAFMIHLQGDDGSALIFIFICVIMLYVAGLRYVYVLAAFAAAVVAAPLAWFYVLKADQKMRILTLINPELDADYAYQQLQGRIALGFGGVEGTGIFSGKHLPVPEVHNDFILAFIGESAGFIGAVGVVLLLAALCFRILYNSSTASDDTGRMICVGVFGMLLAQTIINLGMCLSLLPVIGVTLPLFSAGGTSILSLYISLGLVLSVYRQRTKGLFSA